MLLNCKFVNLRIFIYLFQIQYGILFQDPCINRNLTVTQNISLDQPINILSGHISQYHLTVDFVVS